MPEIGVEVRLAELYEGLAFDVQADSDEPPPSA